MNDKDETKTWLIGIPVRVGDSVMRDRDTYLALVESVRAFVAGSGGELGQRRLRGAWELVCDELLPQIPVDAARAAKHGTGGFILIEHMVRVSTAVQVYMALTGASLPQVIDGVLAAADPDSDIPPAPGLAP